MRKPIDTVDEDLKVRRTLCCATCECCRSWTTDDGFYEWWLDCHEGGGEHVSRPWHDSMTCAEWRCDQCYHLRDDCGCLEGMSIENSLRHHIAERNEVIRVLRREVSNLKGGMNPCRMTKKKFPGRKTPRRRKRSRGGGTFPVYFSRTH